MNVGQAIFLTETTYATPPYELQKGRYTQRILNGKLQPKQKEEGKGGTMRKSLMFLIITKYV